MSAPVARAPVLREASGSTGALVSPPATSSVPNLPVRFHTSRVSGRFIFTRPHHPVGEDVRAYDNAHDAFPTTMRWLQVDAKYVERAEV
jgi:hypothetical protein